MKKTLIALTVAIFSVSGAAHAWNSGDFNDSFDINGTITVDSFKDKWEWIIGPALSFENNSTEMTNNKTTLTITQSAPVPILLGHTKEAFAVSPGSADAIPLISFSDYEGQSISLQSSGEANKGYFDLPMKDGDGNKLGNVKVNVTSAGLLSKSVSDAGRVRIMSLLSNDNMHIYYGGLVSDVVSKGQEASVLVGKFGNYNHTALLGQITSVLPALSSASQSGAIYATSTNMVDTNGDVLASAYSLGIDQGQTIEATFTTPVVKTTQWSAPLNVAVTYN